jgi:CDP-paratose 2-epimerase
MKVLIIGGAGFIGSNAASRFLRRGDQVIVIDNLSREGAAGNLEWLRTQGRLIFLNIDVREARKLGEAFRVHRDASLILHLAAQVAVTTSVADPRDDFEINALGTLNVLEAARFARISAPLIYSSTNKVYGAMDDVGVADFKSRYELAKLPYGIAESRPLDFHSPYGCSKGAGDQYVRDYHRIFGLNTVVFRQSCIYGPRQFGSEDQGWAAWFMLALKRHRPIVIYGNGKQVRDILFVDDLLDAFEAAAKNIGVAAGQIYNVGGGPANAISLLEFLSYLEERTGNRIRYSHSQWRPGDQRVYVTDIRRINRELGWSPRVSWRQGLDSLYQWVSSGIDGSHELRAGTYA